VAVKVTTAVPLQAASTKRRKGRQGGAITQ